MQPLDAQSRRDDFSRLSADGLVRSQHASSPELVPVPLSNHQRAPNPCGISILRGYSQAWEGEDEEAGPGAGFYLRQQRVGFLTLVSIHQSKGRRRPPGQLAPL